MAPPKKIYVHYEEGEEENHVTLKLTLPKKWVKENVGKIKNFFLESYNAKKPNNILNGDDYHLKGNSGNSLRDDAIVEDTIVDREDLYLTSGVPKYKSVEKKVVENSTNETTQDKNLLRCRNYGCNTMFNPAENETTSCKHHTSPPIFHDAKKGWSCCKTKMVYDWDEFQLIEGCSVGKHSTVDPKEMFAPSPSTVAAQTPSSATTETPVVLKSIDDYNSANPNAATAVSSATNAMKNIKIPPKARTDGKAKCVHFGCQKEYVVAENNPTSCRHHAQAPVFHDVSKYWGCCPDTVKYDFESFLEIPGCVVSPHSDHTN